VSNSRLAVCESAAAISIGESSDGISAERGADAELLRSVLKSLRT